MNPTYVLDLDGLEFYDDQRNLLVGEVPGTTQEYTFSGDGKVVTRVDHKKGATVVRSDAYTYGDTTITEVRTMSGVGTLTIVTNTETLATSVTFAAA